MGFPGVFTEYARLVEQRLERFVSEQDAPEILKQAMLYSLTAGGKRLRPAILLEFYRVLGGDPADALPAACGIEMVHTYSLIHDDLPCMDNDDLRRGKPACHIAFGEDTALLAGDALLTLAFEVTTRVSSAISPQAAAQAVRLLAGAAGMSGMVGGQVLDLQSEGKQITLEQLQQLQEGKTVALLRAAGQIACALAGANTQLTTAAEEYCVCIGRAFQIRDDILDVIGDTKTLGKPVRSDVQNRKNTYVSLLGVEQSAQLAASLTAQAKAALQTIGNCENLGILADALAGRMQ